VILADTRRTLPAVALAAAVGAGPALYYRHRLDVARHCPLTGLPARELWTYHAERLVRRDAGDVLVAFVDLNRFKQINDTHGHDVGDIVLQLQANRLKTWTRGRGVAGRLAGDEFAAAVRIHRGGAEYALERLAGFLAAPLHHQGTQIPLSASIGACRPAGGSLAAALHTADVAMYEAKHGELTAPRWTLADQVGPEPTPSPRRRVRHFGPEAVR
jgi:diguanylate cyclase (GGDEF)-like protein